MPTRKIKHSLTSTSELNIPQDAKMIGEGSNAERVRGKDASIRTMMVFRLPISPSEYGFIAVERIQKNPTGTRYFWHPYTGKHCDTLRDLVILMQEVRHGDGFKRLPTHWVAALEAGARSVGSYSALDAVRSPLDGTAKG